MKWPNLNFRVCSPTIRFSRFRRPSPWRIVYAGKPEDCALRGRNTIGAENDLDAIRAFVVRRFSENTRRTYEREIFRLWYWAIIERDTPISSLLYEDFAEFRKFLKDPQPQDFWVGPPVPRSNPNWRPFFRRRELKGKPEGQSEPDEKVGLERQSRDLAMSIIKGMLDFWHRSGYLIGNPLADLRPETETENGESKTIDVSKLLSKEQWSGVLASIDAMPRTKHKEMARWHRVRYLTHMLCGLGPRISELEFSSQRDQRPATHAQITYKEGTGWWITVVGKGNKKRSVPIHPELLQVISEFRQFHGSPPYPMDKDPMPLLPPLLFDRKLPLDEQGITARRANKILDGVFKGAAEFVSPEARPGLSNFSAHSFRDTSVSRDMGAGVPPNLVKLKHGHQSIDTTLLYTHETDADMAKQLSRRRLRD